MIQKRPTGITVLGGLFTVIGGFASFMLFVAIFDSLRLYGMQSIVISSPDSFLGFVLYGITPIMFYTTGVNLYLARPWARLISLFIIPIVSLLFVSHIAYNLALSKSHSFAPSFGELLANQFDVFSGLLILYLAIFAPVEYYLIQPQVVDYFAIKKD